MSRGVVSKYRTKEIAATEDRQLLVLKNGLKVVLHNMPHRKAATVGIWVPVGSAVETEEEAGYSHFVEHMLFKGTKRRSYSDISREIDRLGGYINASTTREMTNYYVTLSGRYVSVALDVLADMYFDSVFGQKDFDTEKKVILEEIRMSEDNPDDYVFDLFFENAYPKTSFGRSIAGSIESISDSTRKKLITYYQNRYGTQGVVLSLAGGLYGNETERRKLEKEIRRLFDRMEHPLSGAPSLDTINYPKVPSGKVFHKRKKLEQVHFIIGLPGNPFLYSGFAELEVFNNIMGGSMSSRLFRKLREEYGLCYSIGSSTNCYYRTGLWSLYCATSKENYLKAVSLAVKEIRSALTRFLPVDEVQENISNITGGMDLLMENPQFHARYNAMGLIFHNQVFNWKNTLREYEAITPEKLACKMRDLWQGSKMTFTALGDLPNKSIVQEAAELVCAPLI